jgi:thymidylate kinase
MLSIAFVGPDGAGKTTISRQLEQAFPLPVKYVYMGINLSSSNVMLPTSRLILAIKRALGQTPDRRSTAPRQHLDEANSSKNVVKRIVAWLRSYLSLANLLAEECFRHSLVWYYQRQGKVVLLDRWFYADFYASSVTDQLARPISRRIHSYMLEHVYPKPDLVIYLEAPAEVLFARKGEATLERLERRRQEYLRVGEIVKHFAVVDASQTAQTVASDVTALIYNLYQTKVGNDGNGHLLKESTRSEER